MRPAAIILAAGLGTRMRSAQPKVLHPLAGRPMIQHLISACEQVFGRIVVVVGPDMPALEDAVAPREVVVQRERLGTGHAALQAAPLLGGHQGDVAVLYGDNPLISEATLQRWWQRVSQQGLCCSPCDLLIPRVMAAWCWMRNAKLRALWNGRMQQQKNARSGFAMPA